MAVQFASGGALYPFFTPYLASQGLDVVEISLVALATACTACVMPFVWGAIADRWIAANRLIVALHLAGAFVLVAAGRFEHVVWLVVMFALYSGVQQPTIPLVSALSYHALENPAREFGKLRLWGSIGWMLPSLPIYVWLAWNNDRSLDVVIWLTAGLHFTIVALAPLWPHTPPVGRRSSDFRADVRALIHTPGFVRLLVVTFFTMASFAIMYYFTSLALEHGGLARRWIGPVLSIGVAFEVPLFLLLPRMLARLGYRRVIALGIVAALVRHVAFAASSDPFTLGIAAMLIAPSVVFFIIATSLAVDRFAAKEVRATAQALFTLAGTGLGMVSGLAASAFLAQPDSLVQPFLLAAACAAAGLLVLPSVRFEATGPDSGQSVERS